MEPTRTEDEWRQLVAEAYTDRNLLAQLVGCLAEENGWRVGFIADPAEPEWPVLVINLPTGQISYHLPGAEGLWPFGLYQGTWDGHTTEQKRERIRAYLVEEMCWVRRDGMNDGAV